jgi:uncharacterized lipoprotein YbaY
VRGTAKANESSIVASELYHDVTKVPFAFQLDFASSDIDPTVTYTVQAMIADGADAWVTSRGVPVLTKGNPTTVSITLTYRPDVLKGAVAGQITAVGLQPSTDAYALAILVDPSTGESIGIDSRPVDNGLPAAFSVPYLITDIDPTNDYVVTAEIHDTTGSWRNAAGVPVITKGNPKTAIQVPVTQVLVASSPSPSPTPAASPAPAPASEDTGIGGVLTAIILVAVAGAIAAFFIIRGRNQTAASTPPPTDPTAPPDETATPGVPADLDSTASTGMAAAAAATPGEPPTEAGTAEATAGEPPTETPTAAPAPEPPPTDPPADGPASTRAP